MAMMQLKAALKDYIWGGTALKERFGKQTDLDRVAESWELSCHADGPSVVMNGRHAGKTLAEALEAEGGAVLGKNCEGFAFFPVLIKLIDAKADLSIQVHPNDEYARRVEGGYGKTEMWYIVDCEPGARLYYGFQRQLERAELERHITGNTLEGALNAVQVKKGDVFFIDAGTIHAIGAGILIAEIQQNSNSTYRVYDYGRLGADGKPRQLHVEKALDVTDTAPPHPTSKPGEPLVHEGYTQRLLSRCDYFTVHLAEIFGTASFTADASSFHSVVCLSGEGVLSGKDERFAIRQGDSFFIPANSGTYELAGTLTVVRTTV